MRNLSFIAVIALLLSACGLVPAPVPTDTPTPQPATSTPTPAVSCRIEPHDTAVPIYQRPSIAADQFGMLAAGQPVQATARTADGFYGFDPGVAQAGNYGLFRLRWILRTEDISTEPGCANVPVVVGPITGVCYAMFDHDTPLYSNPVTGAAVIATYHMGDYAMIAGHAPGWFTLDLNVGSPSMETLGFLKQNDLGGLNGPCDAFTS